MKRILFVDDEEKHLQDLERSLQSEKALWEMSFLTSPKQALTLASAGAPLDVVVAGLGMTEMDGLEFLTKIKTLYPDSIRFGMTGSGSNSSIIKASNVAHQLLEKPCEPHKIRVLITRACSLRDHLAESPLKKRLHAVGGVPSLTVLYQEVMNEIHSADPSLAKVAEIIEKDIGMSAKLLQVVNSAGAGLKNKVSSVVQAASLLGMQKISAMVLMVEVFSLMTSKELPSGFSVESLWDHSLKVGEYAKKIAKNEVDEAQIIDDSFTGGLLHDLGLVILATRMPKELGDALRLAKAEKLSLFEAEKRVFQSTHAEAGGYLLELWGLPDPLVESVTYHDYPSMVPEKNYPSAVPEHGFTPLTAVHVANYFCEDERARAYGAAEAEADTAFLDRLGFTEKLEEWWDLCQQEEW